MSKNDQIHLKNVAANALSIIHEKVNLLLFQ